MKKVLRGSLAILMIMTLLGIQAFAVGLPPVPTGTLYVDSSLAGKTAGAAVTVDGKAGVFGTTAFATIPTAITKAVAGNTIKIIAGTYSGQTLLTKQVNVQILGNISLTSTFYVQATATVEGIANASGVYPTVNLATFPTATWGFSLQADNVVFKNLNIIGSKHYAVKPQVKTGNLPISNLSIENVAITGSVKTGLDLNGVNTATIKNVTVKNTTNGAGISLSDSNDITLDNVVTGNNAWGGISVQTSSYVATPGCNNIIFKNMTTANQVETTPVYSEQVSPAKITNVMADELYPYKVIVNATSLSTGKAEVFTAYYAALETAQAYSALWDNAPYTQAYTGITKEIIQPEPISTSPAVPYKERVKLDFSYAYLYGYEMGGVGASDTIKREEASALIYRLLKQNNKLDGFTAPENASFSDVKTNRWSFSAIEYMTSIGVFDKVGKLIPGAAITRGEASKIIAYSLGLQPNAKTKIKFSDLPIDHVYYYCIKALVDEGILKGYEDGTIRPDGFLTRAEYVTMINRIIGRDDSYNVDGQQNIYPDLSASHWAYKDIMRASFGFTADENGVLKIDPKKKPSRYSIDYK